MPFDYNRHKKSEDSGSFWTSYSDLFLGMSVIFLLLYVTTSLRTGTDGLSQALENKRLTMQVEDLQNQLKAYDSVRKDYLTSASAGEEQQYSELMDKLTLLQEEANNERDRLRKAANENAQKAQALNQYQQMVRNIINANVMAKTKIKTREDVIGEQDVAIDSQKKEISSLNSDISQKKSQIAKAEKKLKEQLDGLKAAYKKQKMTQASFDKKTKALRAEAKATTERLKGEIENANSELKAKLGELEQTRGTLAKKENENRSLQAKASNLEGENEALAGQKRALEGQKSALEGQNRALAGQKQQLEGQANALAGALEKEKEGSRNLGAKLKDTEGLLARAKAEADARRQIARDIKSGFAAAGIKADVDPGTGEVVLSFGDVYFENDSAKLKAQMKEILEKAMPVYSRALLGNKKVASKISSVEIIGFASPTYKGKYVDPESMTPGDRKAVDYNLDLSFQRAKSIFQYVFDENNMRFDHQKQLLPLVKVTGRSFLAEKSGRNPANGGNDFCSQHDCRKAQRVIIRFNTDDKKK